jgi:hypothetical protein
MHIREAAFRSKNKYSVLQRITIDGTTPGIEITVRADIQEECSGMNDNINYARRISCVSP